MRHYRHVIIILAALVIMGIAAFIAKNLFQPDSFGIYGHYRAEAIDEEAARLIRHGTNTACLSCHAHEAGTHLGGKHRTISCEFCHGTAADHVENNKKIAALPVKKEGEITTLCLRCHNRMVEARPKDVIKTVVRKIHLEERKVKPDHNCNQCHQVHAPLQYIIRAEQIMKMTETMKMTGTGS